MCVKQSTYTPTGNAIWRMDKLIGDTVVGSEILREFKDFMVSNDMMHPSHDIKLVTRASAVVKGSTRVWNPTLKVKQPVRRCIRKMTQLEALCDTSAVRDNDSEQD
jgi:hypothetical protein